MCLYLWSCYHFLLSLTHTEVVIGAGDGVSSYEGCSLFIATWVLKHKGIVLYLKTLVHPFKMLTL